MRRFIVVLSILAACSHGGGTTTTVATQMVGAGGGMATSADGKLELTIPAGALGTDTMITIRPVTNAELDPALQALDIAGAYELGPDGLQFAQPVKVSLRLDGSPVLPDGTLLAELVLLLTESGGTVEAASSIVVEADGDAEETIVTGEITNFSRLIGVKSGVTAEVEGVPDSLFAGGRFSIGTTVRSSPESTVASTIEVEYTPAGSLTPPFAKTAIGTIRANSEDEVSQPVGPFTCTEPGAGTFRAIVTFNDLDFLFILMAVPASSDVDIILKKTVTHTDSSPDETQEFQTGLILLEKIRAVPAGFAGTDPATQHGLAAHQFGVSLLDLTSGAEVATVADTGPFLIYDAFPIQKVSEDSVFFAGLLVAAFAEKLANEFAEALLLDFNGDFRDASQHEDGNCVLYVNKTPNTIMQLYDDPVIGEYDVKKVAPRDGDTFDPILSVHQRSATEPLYFTTENDELRRIVTPGGPDEFVAATQSNPSRVRGLEGFLAVVNTGSDSVSLIREVGGSFQVDHVPVGRSPTDVVVGQLPSGDYCVATISPLDLTYTVIEMTEGGVVVNNTTRPLPETFELPSGITLMPGGEYLLITDLTTGRFVIVPIQLQV